jgi:hypothetical protein
VDVFVGVDVVAGADADVAGHTPTSSGSGGHLREHGYDALDEVTLLGERGTREESEGLHRVEDRSGLES